MLRCEKIFCFKSCSEITQIMYDTVATSFITLAEHSFLSMIAEMMHVT